MYNHRERPRHSPAIRDFYTLCRHSQPGKGMLAAIRCKLFPTLNAMFRDQVPRQKNPMPMVVEAWPSTQLLNGYTQSRYSRGPIKAVPRP